MTCRNDIIARRRRSGFTLIEMIVAVVLLAVGVVAALGCIGAATRSTVVAGEYSTAAMLAQTRLTELQTQTDQLTGGEQQGDFGEDHPAYRWVQQVETTDITGLYKVTLSVEWQSGQTTRSAQFVTYLQTPTDTTTGGASQ